MSELMREALRRYQQPQIGGFRRTRIYQATCAHAASLRAIQEDAEARGTAELAMAQINRQVSAVRRKGAKKTSKSPSG